MNNLYFKFTEFEVNMVYGFKTKKIDSDKFCALTQLKQRQDSGGYTIRNGWGTFYQISSGNNGHIQGLKIGKKNINQEEPITEEPITLKESRMDDFSKWDLTNKSLTGKLTRYLSIRRDGVGALTLCFKFEIKDEVIYNTSDILRTMLLVPRGHQIGDQMRGENQEIERIGSPPIEKPSMGDLSIDPETWENKFSNPFQIMLSTLASDIGDAFNNLIPKWKPFFALDNNEDQKLYDLFEIDELTSCEKISAHGDSQMPYMYIYAKMPFEQYESAFLNDDINKGRKIYSKEIAAILGRWLNAYNVQYASLEHWENTCHLKNSVFVNKFMNSLAFTTFSGLVALTLSPDPATFPEKDIKIVNKYILKPAWVTHETMLRYIEFSRMRWHCSIFVNCCLDLIINDLGTMDNLDRKKIDKNRERIIQMEDKIALNLENPLSYLLDSTLGSSLHQHFNQKVLHDIEEEISQKIDTVRNILEDRCYLMDMRDVQAKIKQAKKRNDMEATLTNGITCEGYQYTDLETIVRAYNQLAIEMSNYIKDYKKEINAFQVGPNNFELDEALQKYCNIICILSSKYMKLKLIGNYKGISQQVYDELRFFIKDEQNIKELCLLHEVLTIRKYLNVLKETLKILDNQKKYPNGPGYQSEFESQFAELRKIEAFFEFESNSIKPVLCANAREYLVEMQTDSPILFKESLINKVYYNQNDLPGQRINRLIDLISKNTELLEEYKRQIGRMKQKVESIEFILRDHEPTRSEKREIENISKIREEMNNIIEKIDSIYSYNIARLYNMPRSLLDRYLLELKNLNDEIREEIENIRIDIRVHDFIGILNDVGNLQERLKRIIKMQNNN